MSACCCRTPQYVPMTTGMGNNCICSLPTLVILILIVLQFSRCNKGHGFDDDGECEGKFECNQVGNGILFIIALFFLSCAGCGRGGLY